MRARQCNVALRTSLFIYGNMRISTHIKFKLSSPVDFKFCKVDFVGEISVCVNFLYWNPSARGRSAHMWNILFWAFLGLWVIFSSSRTQVYSTKFHALCLKKCGITREEVFAGSIRRKFHLGVHNFPQKSHWFGGKSESPLTKDQPTSISFTANCAACGRHKMSWQKLREKMRWGFKFTKTTLWRGIPAKKNTYGLTPQLSDWHLQRRKLCTSTKIIRLLWVIASDLISELWNLNLGDAKRQKSFSNKISTHGLTIAIRVLITALVFHEAAPHLRNERGKSIKSPSL